MATLQDFLNTYQAIASNLTGIMTQVNEAEGAIARLESRLATVLSQQLHAVGNHLEGIEDRLATVLSQQLHDVGASLGEIKSALDTLNEGVNRDLFTVSDPVKALFLASFPGFEGETARQMASTLETLGPNKLNIADLLFLITHTIASRTTDPDSAQAKAMTALGKLADDLTKTASESSTSLLHSYLEREDTIRDPVQLAWQVSKFISDVILGNITVDQAVAKMSAQISRGMNLIRPALNILEAPFQAAITSTLDEFAQAMIDSRPASPDKARSLAAKAVAKAYEYGQLAHFIAIACEVVQPLKQMGFPQLAAALGDFSGFKEISGTVSRATIGAAITRPMRWWGNDMFTPEILTVSDLVELVQKREISMANFTRTLRQHGFNADDVDLLVRAVWREPSIRDLAIAIEDTTVADDWLLQRVRRAGYDDEDADQLTRSLTQRSLKSARGRLISAALANVTDGLLDSESYRTILESLQLRPEEIQMHIRTAELTARRDYVNAAIATYRNQYINDVISRADFTLALTALDVVPDRAELIVLDADARRAPRIAREEERALVEPIREIQRELVPRYRRLFELGAISEDAYRGVLIEAGISPGVAQTAAILDRQKRDIVINTAAATALERETAALVSETETALRLQFRKGLLDEAQLRRSLEDLGIPQDRAGVIVNQERARVAPPPGRMIEAPEEAKERVIRDLTIQTAVNDFRKARIEAIDLYDALVDQGVDPDEAVARVNLEISRLPVPTTKT